jgi:hypothetical protein
MLGYFGAFFARYALLPRNPACFFCYTSALTALLITLCWWKGEPARWRRGDD